MSDELMTVMSDDSKAAAILTIYFRLYFAF